MILVLIDQLAHLVNGIIKILTPESPKPCPVKANPNPQ